MSSSPARRNRRTQAKNFEKEFRTAARPLCQVMVGITLAMLIGQNLAAAEDMNEDTSNDSSGDSWVAQPVAPMGVDQDVQMKALWQAMSQKDTEKRAINIVCMPGGASGLEAMRYVSRLEGWVKVNRPSLFQKGLESEVTTDQNKTSRAVFPGKKYYGIGTGATALAYLAGSKEDVGAKLVKQVEAGELGTNSLKQMMLDDSGTEESLNSNNRLNRSLNGNGDPDFFVVMQSNNEKGYQIVNTSSESPEAIIRPAVAAAADIDTPLPVEEVSKGAGLIVIFGGDEEQILKSIHDAGEDPGKFLIFPADKTMTSAEQFLDTAGKYLTFRINYQTLNAKNGKPLLADGSYVIKPPKRLRNGERAKLYIDVENGNATAHIEKYVKKEPSVKPASQNNLKNNSSENLSAFGSAGVEHTAGWEKNPYIKWAHSEYRQFVNTVTKGLPKLPNLPFIPR
ncbi:MAG: hypothetical protein PHW76_01575 [Alphaproteobacteria bacterium]|nr:hypothetical protein [Alphaproteobacteria bacterium]